MQEFLQRLSDPWFFLVFGYFFTISIETPVLCVGLSPQHPLSRRIMAGFWLTACTYPMVVLVIPYFFPRPEDYVWYLLVAESIAHFGECLLFYLAFRPLHFFWRDMATVFGANLASFSGGLALFELIKMYMQRPGEPGA